MASPPIVLIPTDNTVENPRFLFGVIAFQPDLVEGTPGGLAINILDTKWPVVEESGYLIELPPEVAAGLAGFLARVPESKSLPMAEVKPKTYMGPMASESGNAADAFKIQSPPFQGVEIPVLGVEEVQVAPAEWPVKQVVWSHRLVRINPENGHVECSRRGDQTDFDASIIETEAECAKNGSPIWITYSDNQYPGTGAEHLCVVADALVVKNKDGMWWYLSDFTDTAPLMAMPAKPDSSIFRQLNLHQNPSDRCPVCGERDIDHDFERYDDGSIKAFRCKVGAWDVNASTSPAESPAADSPSLPTPTNSGITPSDSTSPLESKAPETTTPA